MIPIRLTLVTLLILLFGFSANASHVSSGAIQYTYEGPGSVPGTSKYRMRVEIYRDCSGTAYSATTQVLTSRNLNSGATATYQLSKVLYTPKPGERPSNNGNRDISDVCSSKATRCFSVNGASGFEAAAFEGVITLSAGQDFEFAALTQCCRNALVNFTSSTSLLKAYLYQNKNSSTRIHSWAKPVKNVVMGKKETYSIGAYDPDGDRLSYQLTCPSNGSVPSQPKIPYTCQSPITQTTLDTNTGFMTFNSSVQGTFLVAVWIREWDRCTNTLKGMIYREFQITFRAGNNTPPEWTASLTNLKNATHKGGNKIEACAGSVVTFSDTVKDINVADSVRFYSEVSNVFPGATYTLNYLTRNEVQINYTIPVDFSSSRPNNRVVLSYAYDDRCDYPGTGYHSFEVAVIPGAKILGHSAACKGESVFLKASGGRKFIWTSLSGDPLTPGVNFFPVIANGDTAAEMEFRPTQNTLLQVETDFYNGCKYTTGCQQYDTMLVTVADSFSLSSSSDLVLCSNIQASIQTTPSQTGLNYSYTWSPAQFLNNDTIANPTIMGVQDTVQFTVEVVSDSGCIQHDTVQVIQLNAFPSNLQAHVSPELICRNGIVDLWVESGNFNFQNCTTTTSCLGSAKSYISGAGQQSNTLTSTVDPIVYGTNNLSSKTVMLYRAADLLQMGLKAGPITSIGWNVTSLGTPNLPLSGFTIHMGCTKDAAVSSTSFPTGLTEVFNPKVVQLATGWNDHKLDESYVWDGSSNLYVEVCWDNSTTRGTGHPIMSFDLMNYAASGRYYANFTWHPVACIERSMSASINQSLLPQTRFTSCEGVRSSRFSYDWHPKSTGGFIGSTSKDSVQASVNQTTASQYWVVVSDSLHNQCKDTSYVSLTVVTQYNVTPDSVGNQCVDNKFIRLSAPILGGVWTGQGITDSVNGVWSGSKSGPGSFYVTYTVTGDSCANQDSVPIIIKGHPDPTILTDSLCEYYADTLQHKLDPLTPGGVMSGKGVDSVLTLNGIVYYINGPKFGALNGQEDTVWVRHTLVDGCTTDSLIGIRILPKWDHTYQGIVHNGMPYLDYTFCLNNAKPDTLSVKGKFPTWSCIEVPSAITDAQNGVIDPTILGTAGSYTLKVENTGFCGGDTLVPISVVQAPEIELTSRRYCEDSCQNLTFRLKTDTFFLKMPRGTAIGGTGDVNLGVPGNDIDLYYASKQNSGWNTSIDDLAFNFWDGGSWMPLTHIARYKPCNLQVGVANKIRYQYAMRYRNSSPDSACFEMDSAYVYLLDCDTTANGIQEFDQVPLLRVSPNPANDRIYVEIDPDQTDWNLTWYTILGEKLYGLRSEEFGTHVLELDISDLPAGNYLLKLDAGDQIDYKKVVIK